jgi:hypothetical protein
MRMPDLGIRNQQVTPQVGSGLCQPLVVLAKDRGDALLARIRDELHV